MKFLFRNTKMIHASRILLWRCIFMALPIVIGLVLMSVLPTAFLRVAAMLGGLIVSLVLLIGVSLSHSIELSLIAQMLKEGKYDRTFFVPASAPCSRTVWSQAIRERLRKLRFTEGSAEGKFAPICLGTKHSTSIGSDRLESFAFVYSVERLDSELYSALLQDVKKRIRAFPPRDEQKHKTRHIKISYGTAAAMVILADSVDEAVLPRAKETFSVRDGELFSAVVDCGAHRVYMNGGKFPQVANASDAQRLIARLVFDTSGTIPRDSGELTEEYRRLYAQFEAKTYGEFLAESKNAEKESAEEEKKLFEELKNGEFRLIDGALYCKEEGKLMSMIFFPKDDSEAPIGTPAQEGRVIEYDPLFLSWDCPKHEDMSEQDKSVYLPRLIAYMESLGYIVEKEED